MATRARPRRLPRALPAGPRREVILYVALFVAAALVSAFTILQQVDPFDEGLVLQAARRVSQGQLPYGDFQWAYGPAQPYLLAGLFKLFGTSLLQWRVLRSLCDAAVAILAFALARREVGTRWALLTWLAVAGEMAEPRSANPFPYALACVLGAVLVATRGRAVLAGVLIAVAAAFRLDFALYGAGAIVVCLAFLPEPGRVRGVARFAGVAGGLTLLAYLPFLVQIGPSRLYDAVFGTSLSQGSYWTLPFPLHYSGTFSGLEDVKHVIDFYVPALLVAGLALAGGAALLRLRRERRLPPSWLALLAFGAGALAYLLSRTDEFHTAPLLVVLAVLLPALAVRRPRVLGVAAAAVFALLLVHGVANRVSALFRPPHLSTVHVAVADGAQAPPAEARSIERLVAIVQSRVPPGQPIYVAPRRSDLVRFNDPLVYVLTERDNPTSQDFGLQTSAAAQASLVAKLRGVNPPLVVRWTDPISSKPEPNRRGRSSGVHTLDLWLAAHYRLLVRLYHYDVLVPR